MRAKQNAYDRENRYYTYLLIIFFIFTVKPRIYLQTVKLIREKSIRKYIIIIIIMKDPKKFISHYIMVN